MLDALTFVCGPRADRAGHGVLARSSDISSADVHHEKFRLAETYAKCVDRLVPVWSVDVDQTLRNW